jgi:hypothetical protein
MTIHIKNCNFMKCQELALVFFSWLYYSITEHQNDNCYNRPNTLRTFRKMLRLISCPNTFYFINIQNLFKPSLFVDLKSVFGELNLLYYLLNTLQLALSNPLHAWFRIMRTCNFLLSIYYTPVIYVMRFSITAEVKSGINYT